MAIHEGTDDAPPVPAGEDPVIVSALVVNGWRVDSCTGEIVRESRFRPVFRYRVNYTDRSSGAGYQRIVIGKADYRHGAEATYEYMRRLWSAGFAADRDRSIPEPVAYLGDRSLLLQTEAPGRCLYEWLDEPRSGNGTARAAGAWLSRLHATDIGGDGHLPPDYEERKLHTYLHGLAEVLPDRAARLEELTAGALDALVPLATGPVVPTHGDYQPKNIYVDGPRVTVIDWDRGALSHPARDVGHFVGQSLTMSFAKTGTFERVRPWNDAFLDGYGNGPDGSREAGLRPYLARTMLEVLYYKLVVKPVRDAGFVDTWLDELERSLAN